MFTKQTKTFSYSQTTCTFTTPFKAMTQGTAQENTSSYWNSTRSVHLVKNNTEYYMYINVLASTCVVSHATVCLLGTHVCMHMYVCVGKLSTLYSMCDCVKNGPFL